MKLTDFHETDTKSMKLTLIPMTLSNAAKVDTARSLPGRGTVCTDRARRVGRDRPVDRTLSHVDEGRCTRGMDLRLSLIHARMRLVP